MPINKTSRIQYSINTTFPFILPTLKYVSENYNEGLKRSVVRQYIVKNYSQGKSQKSEMDIVSKVIDRYLEEDDKKQIQLGDIGTALLKTWDKYPQTRNELLVMGYSQHFIVEFTIKEIHQYLMNNKKKLVANDLKRKVKALDIYPDLATNIEKNTTEVLKDLIRLHILPEKESNAVYNIAFYKPTAFGLLYFILYYFPEWQTISLRALDQSELLKILLTDMTGIKNAFDILCKKSLARFESFADVQKYVVILKTMGEFNARI